MARAADGAVAGGSGTGTGPAWIMLIMMMMSGCEGCGQNNKCFIVSIITFTRFDTRILVDNVSRKIRASNLKLVTNSFI